MLANIKKRHYFCSQKSTNMKKNQPQIATLGFSEAMIDKVFHVEETLTLTDGLDITAAFPKFFRVPAPVAVLLDKGTIHSRINLHDICLQAPCLAISHPSDILEIIDHSDDVEGRSLLIDERFASRLDLNDYELHKSIQLQSVIPLSEEAYMAVARSFDMIRSTMLQTDNPYQKNALIALLRAFYYGAGYYFHKSQEQQRATQTRDEQIVEQFMQLVHTYCRKERRLEFYAGKMCLSTKYMANIIAARTKKSAGQWISDYVILEAKALLGSGTAVGAVSDLLHFPDQSTFGKFFRRQTGMTPAEYRKNN